MFGRLQISQPHTAITIPTTALVKRMGITGVFTVTNDRPQFIPIAPGKVYGDRVEIKLSHPVAETTCLQIRT
ncbi:MAG: efflux RND transporter periplasmic adaptor subunit [Hormoscilla sp. GM7CHS1pb]|nr:efflux RND transporter periplasmic adaptor subunit [Hormoscilla sp. GM7CHS1pb]